MNTIQKEEISENLSNAVQVILKTYENIEKLFSEMDLIAPQYGLHSITPRFLRWKSDNYYHGWMVTSFIKLYQSTDDPMIDSNTKFRNGPIYVVDVTLYDQYNFKPTITIGKYLYESDELKKWGKAPSVSEHWGFYYPTRKEEDFKIEELENHFKSTPLPGKKTDYWNLQYADFLRLDLISVDSEETIKNNIFGQLKSL